MQGLCTVNVRYEGDTLDQGAVVFIEKTGEAWALNRPAPGTAGVPGVLTGPVRASADEQHVVVQVSGAVYVNAAEEAAFNVGVFGAHTSCDSLVNIGSSRGWFIRS
jgi:hypothetical protein